ncbi:MAG: isoaspartyl peptidase/L-asparaginase [Saprospiraceae bacterium]|nr:isoaspartyl peptidase/L-asparaginase [Saprospiraceae bacterium]
MKKSLYLLFVFFTGILIQSCTNSTAQEQNRPDWAIIIHGGAGPFWNGNITEEKKANFFNSLDEALSVGQEILANGGESIDAVEAAIKLLEDDPQFNAGKGAVLTSIGTAELDASIMNGADLNSGAVAGVRNVKHPISAARLVMEASPHVMLAGAGAEEFAATSKLELVENDYFITEARLNQFENRVAALEKEKMGTVGCVAIDQFGNIVAATSTGGTFMKKWGRVGDSPIIGAGTYANNASCGVSATGAGEFFIRGTVARDIAALMEYKNMSLQDAADEIIHSKLPAIDKEKAVGGIIALDKDGNIGFSFNTKGMLRAYANSEGIKEIGLY